jgi:hypothetical protein
MDEGEEEDYEDEDSEDAALVSNIEWAEAFVVDIGFITGDYTHNSLRQDSKLVRLSALGLIRSLMCFCKYTECIDDDRTVLLKTALWHILNSSSNIEA